MMQTFILSALAVGILTVVAAIAYDVAGWFERGRKSGSHATGGQARRRHTR